jgi:hypothetical protein
VPPAVALLNYISSGLLWRIFCQTGTFRGVFSKSLILPFKSKKERRITKRKDKKNYTIKGKTKIVRAYGRTGA